MEFVTEQEKKYQEKLSPHSNFYCHYFIIQKFLQIQLKNQPSLSRRNLSLTILHGFGQGLPTGHNIVQWKKL